MVSDHGAAISVSRNGLGDARDLLPAAAGVPEKILRDALNEARRGVTNRLGELLGPMGIRYVAIIDRAGPDEDPVPFSNSWQRSLDSQLDLVARRVDTGMELYENSRWIPIRATFQGADADLVRNGADAKDPLGAAASISETDPKPFPATKPAAGDVVVLAESNAPGWTAPGGKRFAAYGWANGFTGKPSAVNYSGDRRWFFARIIGGGAWVVLLAVLFLTRRREEMA
jgi:hypothetical protein